MDAAQASRALRALSTRSRCSDQIQALCDKGRLPVLEAQAGIPGLPRPPRVLEPSPRAMVDAPSIPSCATSNRFGGRVHATRSCSRPLHHATCRFWDQERALPRSPSTRPATKSRDENAVPQHRGRSSTSKIRRTVRRNLISQWSPPFRIDHPGEKPDSRADSSRVTSTA